MVIYVSHDIVFLESELPFAKITVALSSSLIPFVSTPRASSDDCFDEVLPSVLLLTRIHYHVQTSS